MVEAVIWGVPGWRACSGGPRRVRVEKWHAPWRIIWGAGRGGGSGRQAGARPPPWAWTSSPPGGPCVGTGPPAAALSPGQGWAAAAGGQSESVPTGGRLLREACRAQQAARRSCEAPAQRRSGPPPRLVPTCTRKPLRRLLPAASASWPHASTSILHGRGGAGSRRAAGAAGAAGARAAPPAGSSHPLHQGAAPAGPPHGLAGLAAGLLKGRHGQREAADLQGGAGGGARAAGAARLGPPGRRRRTNGTAPCRGPNRSCVASQRCRHSCCRHSSCCCCCPPRGRGPAP
jgi:hypothetical protein